MSNVSTAPVKSNKRDWSMPNYLAQARILAGGDWRAAMLLYRITQVWTGTKNKRLKRIGMEWVAMPRDDWARSAGLTESEIKNYALPKLKKECGAFLRFESWRLRAEERSRLLWVHVDEAKVPDYLEEVPFYDLENQRPKAGVGVKNSVILKFPKKAAKNGKFDHLK